MNIYVGNLNYDLSEDDLKNAFENMALLSQLKLLLIDIVVDLKVLDLLK